MHTMISRRFVRRFVARPLFQQPSVNVSRLLVWLFAPIVLLDIASAAIHPNIRCPGNVEILHVRKAQRSLIIAQVFLNHNGPYEFLVDTGTQVTVLAPAVVADIDLIMERKTSVKGIGSISATFAHIDSLQVGSHDVKGLLVTVQNLDYLEKIDARVRAVLGSNFLALFDVLIDYSHDILCLDSDRAMQRELKGEHNPLLSPVSTAEEQDFATPPIIGASFLSKRSRNVRFLLDSGTNSPLVYLNRAGPLMTMVSTHGIGIDGLEHEVKISSPQDILIGTQILRSISFAVLAANQVEQQSTEFGGLLPTALFHRVFISYESHYAVLDPK